MKKIWVVGVLSAVVLSACDQVEQIGAIMNDEPLTIAFAPGFRILAADATAVPIQGFDECPKPNPAFVKLFGEGGSEGKNTCVVVKPTSKQVSALVSLPNGSVTEQWTVLRDQGKSDSGRPYSRISLRRPDGSLVVAAVPQ